MPAEIANRELHGKTKALVGSALRLLLSSIEEGEGIPQRTMEIHKVTGPGAWSQDYEERPDYWIFADHHEKEIQALPEFDDWLRAMHGDVVIAKHLDSLVGTSQGGIRRTPWEYLIHLLTKQLRASPTKFEFNADAFDSTYEEMEGFFHRDVVGFRAFSPLQNFTTDVDVIELGGNLRIRKITNRELEELLDASAYGSMIPFGEIPNYRYAIEMEYETEKIFGMLKTEDLKPPPDQGIFGKLLTALRLFKPGIVGFNVVQTIPLVDTPSVFGGMRGALEYKRFLGPLCALMDAEVEAFKEFWMSFSKINLAHLAPIGIAISRFNYAYERQSLEDKLIDYMIAFEALFFKENEKGEFRHKISIRVARLLGRDYEERKRIAQEMTEFYDKRSAVVHGEKVRLASPFVERVEGYLRESIKHAVLDSQAIGHDEVISRLDLE